MTKHKISDETMCAALFISLSEILHHEHIVNDFNALLSSHPQMMGKGQPEWVKICSDLGKIDPDRRGKVFDIISDLPLELLQKALILLRTDSFTKTLHSVFPRDIILMRAQKLIQNEIEKRKKINEIQ